mgnify:CR=1 FL=1|jgi:hypothetical protein
MFISLDFSLGSCSRNPNPNPQRRPLVDAVKKELSYMWHASGSELSKRVEDLIERDYLERDETDQLMLLYVA